MGVIDFALCAVATPRGMKMPALRIDEDSAFETNLKSSFQHVADMAKGKRQDLPPEFLETVVCPLLSFCGLSPIVPFIKKLDEEAEKD